jgi:hypothetical protein
MPDEHCDDRILDFKNSEWYAVDTVAVESWKIVSIDNRVLKNHSTVL